MLVSLAQTQIFFLALTRVLAILIQVPMLGGNTVPTQVRIAFGLVLTLIVVPWQALPADAQVMDLLPFAFSITRELIIGFLAGFAATLTFAAIQVTGEMMTMGCWFFGQPHYEPAVGRGRFSHRYPLYHVCPDAVFGDQWASHFSSGAAAHF